MGLGNWANSEPRPGSLSKTYRTGFRPAKDDSEKVQNNGAPQEVVDGVRTLHRALQ